MENDELETAIHWQFRYIMANGFEEDEIEHLENFADFGFRAVERGNVPEMPERLVLDAVKEYRDDA